MPYFTDFKTLSDLVEETFVELMKDPAIKAKALESKLTVKFEYRDPDGELWGGLQNGRGGHHPPTSPIRKWNSTPPCPWRVTSPTLSGAASSTCWAPCPLARSFPRVPCPACSSCSLVIKPAYAIYNGLLDAKGPRRPQDRGRGRGRRRLSNHLEMEWSGWLDAVERQLHAGDDPRGQVLAGQIRDRVLHKAYLKKGDVVADLGCGKGFLTLEAARLVGEEGRVTGIDASEEALEKARGEAVARGLSNLVFIQAGLTSLPLETGSVGVVLARSVFAYVAERRDAFREAWRILEPGGRISLFEPVVGNETYQLDWGRRKRPFRR